MSKTKKGLVNAGSILTIVSCGFAILLSILMFSASAIISEDFVKDTLKEMKDFQYHETIEGDYYFSTIEDGVELIIEDDEIQMITQMASVVLKTFGYVVLTVAAAKLILAIKNLINSGKNKYGLGSVIALLVLNILSFGLVEAALLIASLCIKNSDKQEENKNLKIKEIKSDFEQITIE